MRSPTKELVDGRRTVHLSAQSRRVARARTPPSTRGVVLSDTDRTQPTSRQVLFVAVTLKVAMTDTTQFSIGVEASCIDGLCGEVSRVVVDPVARVLTHLVVESGHRPGLGKLVPLDLVDTASGQVRLHCTLAEFEELEAAEETQFLPGTEGYPGYEPNDVISWPYYGLGVGISGFGSRMGIGMGNISHPVTFDVVPVGEVTVRRGEHVHATDGDIGKVQGLVIDPGDHRVTHVLLQEGHLWERKDVAIPIGAVTGVDEDGIALGITKQDVQDLAPVVVEQPSSPNRETES